MIFKAFFFSFSSTKCPEKGGKEALFGGEDGADKVGKQRTLTPTSKTSVLSERELCVV